jgi:hypothetical protein
VTERGPTWEAEEPLEKVRRAAVTTQAAAGQGFTVTEILPVQMVACTAVGAATKSLAPSLAAVLVVQTAPTMAQAASVAADAAAITAAVVVVATVAAVPGRATAGAVAVAVHSTMGPMKPSLATPNWATDTSPSPCGTETQTGHGKAYKPLFSCSTDIILPGPCGLAWVDIARVWQNGSGRTRPSPPNKGSRLTLLLN